MKTKSEPIDDPRRTTKFRLLQLHYTQRAEELTWNAARFRRLAHALQLTVHELGAFFRLKINETEKYLRQDKFPATVELHLTLAERAIYPTSTPPIFPCSLTSTS
jgi:hypothetical protein